MEVGDKAREQTRATAACEFCVLTLITFDRMFFLLLLAPSKLFSFGPSAVLPPVGTEIAAVRTTANRGMSLSYADGEGNRRTSLFNEDWTPAVSRMASPSMSAPRPPPPPPMIVTPTK